MKILDFLSPIDVMTNVAASDKQQLLQELARKAGLIVDELPNRVFAELQKREELGSTGMGGGVAILATQVAGLAQVAGSRLGRAQSVSTSTPSMESRTQAQEPGDHGRSAARARQCRNVPFS
jgi:hypothetical protein